MIKILSDENLTANNFDNFQAIKGETIKGVLSIPSSKGSDWLIFFESGYSLQIHPDTGAFWINNEEHTKELLNDEIKRRASLLDNLEQARKLL